MQRVLQNVYEGLVALARFVSARDAVDVENVLTGEAKRSYDSLGSNAEKFFMQARMLMIVLKTKSVAIRSQPSPTAPTPSPPPQPSTADMSSNEVGRQSAEPGRARQSQSVEAYTYGNHVSQLQDATTSEALFQAASELLNSLEADTSALKDECSRMRVNLAELKKDGVREVANRQPSVANHLFATAASGAIVGPIGAMAAGAVHGVPAAARAFDSSAEAAEIVAAVNKLHAGVEQLVSHLRSMHHALTSLRGVIIGSNFAREVSSDAFASIGSKIDAIIALCDKAVRIHPGSTATLTTTYAAEYDITIVDFQQITQSAVLTTHSAASTDPSTPVSPVAPSDSRPGTA